MSNLRYLREQANLSQEKLGELINVSQQSIYKYEKGEAKASQSVLIKLSKVFNVPIDFLVNDDADVAEFIKKSCLSDEEVALLDSYRNLNTDDKEKLSLLIDEMIKKEKK